MFCRGQYFFHILFLKIFSSHFLNQPIKLWLYKLTIYEWQGTGMQKEGWLGKVFPRMCILLWAIWWQGVPARKPGVPRDGGNFIFPTIATSGTCWSAGNIPDRLGEPYPKGMGRGNNLSHSQALWRGFTLPQAQGSLGIGVLPLPLTNFPPGLEIRHNSFTILIRTVAVP